MLLPILQDTFFGSHINYQQNVAFTAMPKVKAF